MPVVRKTLVRTTNAICKITAEVHFIILQYWVSVTSSTKPSHMHVSQHSARDKQTCARTPVLPNAPPDARPPACRSVSHSALYRAHQHMRAPHANLPDPKQGACVHWVVEGLRGHLRIK